MSAPTDVENGTLMRMRYNVLPLFDIALGRFEKGKDGATFLNGGMSRIMGFGGRGNVFKTYKMSYLAWCMTLRYRIEWQTFYDTEESAEAARQNDILECVYRNNFMDFDPTIPVIRDFFQGKDGMKFTMSNISKLSGTDWAEKWVRDKAPEREKIFKSGKGRKTAPMMNIMGEYETVLPPWIHNCDSLSEWHSDTNDKDVMKSEAGASESNHLAMTDNRDKAQMISRWPKLAGQGEYCFNFTVQLTDDIVVDKYAGNEKKLDTMKGKVKLSGVPAKQISYLTNSLMIATASGELALDGSFNSQTGTTEPLWPRMDARGNTSSYNDLKKVTYTQWRAKSGPTGIKITLIFSQEEGLKAGLSEWYYLSKVMSKNQWGWDRSGNRFYELDIMPDFKFERTTVRNLLDTDAKFARAMSITATICYLYNNTLRLPAHLRMTGKELYQRIIDHGYDWDEILTKTVDWWCFEEDKKHVMPGKNTLTIWSLLEMAADIWHPKFLTRNKSAAKKDAPAKVDEAA